MHADRSPGLRDDGHRQRVAGERGPPDVFSGEVSIPIGDGAQRRGFAGGQSLAGPAGDRRAGGDRLQVPALPTPAERPIRPHRHVAELGGQPVGADEQAVVDDHAAADARAEGEIEQVVGSAAGAMAPLSEPGQIGVVAERHGALEVLLQAIAQGNVHPTGEVGRLDHQAAFRVERPGRPQADPHAPLDPARHLLDRGDDAIDHRLGAFRGQGGSSRNGGRLRLCGRENRRPNVGPAKIDGDDGGHGRQYNTRLPFPSARLRMLSMTRDLTPVRKQYLEIKRQYPDAIVFFRLGDFYETFDADAEVASRELEIVLTSRNVAKGSRIPMAGIPFHAAENYLSRLIAKGYHVAICEQVGETPVRGLFPREVVRVVTPGTVVEAGLLPGEANNYLAAVVLEGDQAGVAYADVSTGEFAATQLESSDPLGAVRHELARLRPAEVLLPESLSTEAGWPGALTRLPDWRFGRERADEALRSHFGTSTLDGFGLGGLPLAARAAGAILDYLNLTQRAALTLLTSLRTYTLSEFMVLDSATRRNLELTETIRSGEVRGSLLGLIDQTVTPMGRRLIRQWMAQPLLDLTAIRARQDQVSAFVGDGMLRAEVRAALRPLGDMERLTNRAAAGVAGPRDLMALREALGRLPEVIVRLQAGPAGALQPPLASLDPRLEARDLLERAIADDPPATLAHSGVIRSGFSEELDGVIESSSKARDWIAGLEQVERQRSGIKSLRVGYNKIFGYYIEVTRANAGLVPAEYIRKQTLVNGERYITPEMKEYEALVLTAEERIRSIEAALFAEVCRQVGEQSTRLLLTARSLAQIDVVAGLAEVAALKGYARPEVVEEDVFEIREGRHPVVEEHLKGERFVPNDAVFEEGERVRVITGPNMSGKSTYLRQVALIVLLAQIGSYVPALSARLWLTDRLFTRIGAQDEIHAGQSTFMVEMVETANILHNATRRSLLILDEIGRGTSTYDGLSIAWAVAEYIHNHPRLRARTLFATHFHELTQLSELLPGVRNYNVAVTESEGKVVFLHKIVPGGADRSYGIHVGQLAGLPQPVVQRASEILRQLEASSGKAVKIDPNLPEQLVLFPETNPLLEELKTLDINTLSPIDALNRLYEWKNKFLRDTEN